MKNQKSGRLNTIVTEIKAVAKNPQKCLDVLERYTPPHKLRRSLERELRLGIAIAYALHREAEQAKTLDKLVQAIKKKDSSVTSGDSRLVLLHEIFDYGEEGKQYASRDKAVILLLESRNTNYNEAPRFIRENGGIYNSAKIYRDEKRGNTPFGNNRPQDRKKRSLASLCPEKLKETGDVGIVLVEVEDAVKKLVRIIDGFSLGEVKGTGARVRLRRHIKIMAESVAEVHGVRSDE